MQIEIPDELVADYIKSQAELQGTTPSELIQKLCRRCRELKLIESLGSTTTSAEWANEPLD